LYPGRRRRRGHDRRPAVRPGRAERRRLLDPPRAPVVAGGGDGGGGGAVQGPARGAQDGAAAGGWGPATDAV